MNAKLTAKYIEAQNNYEAASLEYYAALRRAHNNWRQFSDESLQRLGTNLTRCWFEREWARTNYVNLSK